MKSFPIHRIATLLAGIGALNWLLVALFNLNLVTMLLGDMTSLAKIVYGLVGLSGLMVIISVFRGCPGHKE